jgi:hypothetical protein
VQQIETLFDHLVGAGEQRWRHFEAKRLGCLQVDDEFVLGRCLHWQVGGFLAVEDAIDICGATVLVNAIGPWLCLCLDQNLPSENSTFPSSSLTCPAMQSISVGGRGAQSGRALRFTIGRAFTGVNGCPLAWKGGGMPHGSNTKKPVP